MSMSHEEFERLQYTRVSTIGFDLVETGDDVYPYRIEKHGAVVRGNLRSILDVSEWVDHQQDREIAKRKDFQ